jgi:hypothetical protein
MNGEHEKHETQATNRVRHEPGELMAPARVRNPFRSWRLRWDESEDVAPRRRSPLVWLTLRGGKQIAVCGWGWPLPARRERLALLLRAARPGAAT